MNTELIDLTRAEIAELTAAWRQADQVVKERSRALTRLQERAGEMFRQLNALRDYLRALGLEPDGDAAVPF